MWKQQKHEWSPDVREHRATDQIQLTTDTTLSTVKTKTILSHAAAIAIATATVDFVEYFNCTYIYKYIQFYSVRKE